MTHTAEEVRAFIAHMDATASWLTPGERDIAAAYADLLEQHEAGVTDEIVERVAKAIAADGMGREFSDLPELHVNGLDKNDLINYARAALTAVWPVAAEPAQPVERRWTGPGYLEQTGYIDPQPGEHVSDAESLLRSAAQKAVRANFDLRVRNNEIVGLLSEVLGFIGNVTDDERDIANRITKCLDATIVTEPLRPGYVRCQKCEAQMGGYGYGKFPKLCPVCQDTSTKPAEPAQPADSGRAMDVPMGAIENGRIFADRLESTGLECEAGNLAMCSDWQEFRCCFEYLSEWALHLAAQGQPAERVPDGWRATHDDHTRMWTVHTPSGDSIGIYDQAAGIANVVLRQLAQHLAAAPQPGESNTEDDRNG